MKTLGVLVRRNMMVFCKDKENVFYSTLAMLIIILLMLVFLGKMNVDMVKGAINDIEGQVNGAVLPADQLVKGTRDAALDDANANNLVLSIIIAGITVVNGVTISLGVIGIMIEDEVKKRLSSFYVSPVSRGILVLGYILAAFFMSIIFGIITVIISEGILVITGGTALTLLQSLKVLGLIIINSFSATSLMFFLSSLAHTSSAYAGLSTLVGTLVGFFAGMYLPIGYMPKLVKKILIFIPICSGSAWMRQVFTEKAAVKAFAGLPKAALEGYNEYVGITLKVGGTKVSNLCQFFILFGSGVLFIILSVAVLNKKNVRDR